MPPTFPDGFQAPPDKEKPKKRRRRRKKGEESECGTTMPSLTLGAGPPLAANPAEVASLGLWMI